MDTPQPSTTAFDDDDDQETLADPSATPNKPDNSPMRTIAVSIYRQVWTEFYDWEQDDCRQTLASLAPVASIPAPLLDMPDLDLDLPPANPTTSLTLADLRTGSTSHIAFRETKIRTSIQAHPPYVFCAPTATCISRRPEDPVSSDNMLFIPYADDPTFDYLRKIPEGSYRGLAWQHDWVDPDVELIQLEVLRRLHYGHRLTINDIDGLCVLSKSRVGSESGLLWNTSQRDLIAWPGAALSELSPDLHPNISFAPRADDPQQRLHSLLPIFCGNLSCIRAYCPIHVDTHPIPDRRKPQLGSSKLKTKGNHPCSATCFSYIQQKPLDQNLAPPEWQDSEIADLHTIFGVLPDESPCNLAIICQKPCYEVYYYRCSSYPDENILEKSANSIRRPRKALDFVDSVGPEAHLSYATINPCHHQGPCDLNCPCHINKLHCYRTCQCNADCPRRWRGCNCSKKKKMDCVEGHNCPCEKIHRECDPELCKCGAKNMKGCKNMVVQTKLPQRLQIKKARWGLGAFATQRIREGAFIGEYTGEIISVDQYSDVIDNYLGLNYMFDYNSEYYLDGANIGNETRYLNHPATDQEDNVVATVHQVNRDLKILLTATKTIKKGEELLLDYGENYWKHHRKDVDEMSEAEE